MTTGGKILLPFPQTDSGQRQDIWKTSLFWEKGLWRQVVMKEQVSLEEESPSRAGRVAGVGVPSSFRWAWQAFLPVLPPGAPMPELGYCPLTGSGAGNLRSE